ncbi:MAG TPA: ATP-binding protein [Candidatus Angelobacter sp.]|nr:ATP-binding protein [Candidatus Angelobacter sp.]
MATASDTSRPRRSRWRLPHIGRTRSLGVRLTIYYVILLAGSAAALLIFVNAAAHFTTVPVTIQIPSPAGGFSITQRTIDLAEEQARTETLSRLRYFSILGFLALVLGGVAIGSYAAERALRPISQMAAVARRIGSHNLKERIALQGGDDELKQLADSFDEMVERLDQAFNQQRQFVADASHELRTPLTALQLTIDGIRSDPGATEEDYRQVAASAAEATARMRRLVEDMLALAERDQPPPHGRVALSSLAESVADEMEPLAALRGITVTSTVPSNAIAIGDQLSLRRALTNLVENAIRYNRDGGRVAIEGADAPLGHVAVAVRDDGIGIPPEALAHVFDRFYRVDRGRSRAEGGSGLGLSIVAKIAREHGGRVDVESEADHGSRFVVTLRAPATSGETLTNP